MPLRNAGNVKHKKGICDAFDKSSKLLSGGMEKNGFIEMEQKFNP